ncbi:MAG: polysaccharide deacetylase family protein, partial [Firmicutes bacterium]|nr:polysaccharide deacetylase family protein [Bacillota bacterium]
MTNKVGQVVLIAAICILAVSMVVIMNLLTHGGESIDTDGTTDLIATGTGDAISSISTSVLTSEGSSDESESMTSAPNDTESAATETETEKVTTAEVITAENTTAPAESSEPETTEPTPQVTETEAPKETSAPSEVELTNPEDIDPTLPMIALTFDDGPGAYTDRLLDILERYGVRATFYVVGTQARKYESIIVRESSEGHEIG